MSLHSNSNFSRFRAREIAESTKEIEDLKQKLKFRDEDLDLLYRKNIQLKQTLSDVQSNYMKAHEEINKFTSEKDVVLTEKMELQNRYALMEERYQKELTDLQAVNTQATAALEMLTVFPASASDRSFGTFLLNYNLNVQRNIKQTRSSKES